MESFTNRQRKRLGYPRLRAEAPLVAEPQQSVENIKNKRFAVAATGTCMPYWAKQGASMTGFRHVAAVLLAWGVGGCGLYVPEMQEWYEPPDSQKITENRIINHIKCELHKGVDAAVARYYGAGKRSGLTAEWIKSWLATVSLKLSVQEKSSISPGVSWVRTFSDVKSFTLGAGVNASADATRVETISFTYPLKQLRMGGRIEGPCERPGEALVEGDLKIGQFIDKKVFLSTVPGTIIGPYSAFNYQVTFVIVYGGAATPTWKLIDVTANPDAPFFSTSRTRTHDITITLAPPADAAQEEAARLHNAALIGQAVASALKNQR